MNKCFPTERDLTETALKSFDFSNFFEYSGWNRWEGREIEGLFGIPDVVIAFGKTTVLGKRILRTLAFEMKLRNWQRALIQAYRYAAFSHYSFVVLDEAFSAPALNNIDRFQKSNIGLITVNVNSNITCHYKPKFSRPYSPYTYRNLFSVLKPKLFD